MVIVFGTSIRHKKMRLFFNKRHKSTESSILNCATDKNCDNLGVTTKENKTFFLCDFHILAKCHFKLKKKFENS